MNIRFAIREESRGVYVVIDIEHIRYNLPELACSLRMREVSAKAVAALLNLEWIHFLNHPS